MSSDEQATTTAVVRLVDRAYDGIIKPNEPDMANALNLVIQSALLPLGEVVWTMKRVRDWLHSKLPERLEAKGVTEPQTPDPRTFAAVVQGVAVAGSDELRELYANLLATAMDPETAHLAHPSFAEVLRQINPDEARLLPYLYEREGIHAVIATVHTESPFGSHGLRPRIITYASRDVLQRPDLESVYFHNLERLGIVLIERGVFLDGSSENVRSLEEEAEKLHDEMRQIAPEDTALGVKVERDNGRIILTAYGAALCEACLPELPRTYFPSRKDIANRDG